MTSICKGLRAICKKTPLLFLWMKLNSSFMTKRWEPISVCCYTEQMSRLKSGCHPSLVACGWDLKGYAVHVVNETIPFLFKSWTEGILWVGYETVALANSVDKHDKRGKRGRETDCENNILYAFEWKGICCNCLLQLQSAPVRRALQW